MNKKTFGLIRVSSKDQQIDRQLAVMKKYISDERDIFIEKQSGKDFKRPEYQAMKRMLRAGDTLIIKELDRFGRNSDEIKNEWQWFTENHIGIIIIDMPILNTSGEKDDIQKLISNIVLELLSYMAEKELKDIKKRQREGIDQAKKKGVKFGRPAVQMPEEFAEYFQKLDNYEITAIEMMNDLGLKRNSFYSLLKKYLGTAKYNKWINNREHYKKTKTK